VDDIETSSKVKSFMIFSSVKTRKTFLLQIPQSRHYSSKRQLPHFKLIKNIPITAHFSDTFMKLTTFRRPVQCFIWNFDEIVNRIDELVVFFLIASFVTFNPPQCMTQSWAQHHFEHRSQPSSPDTSSAHPCGDRVAMSRQVFITLYARETISMWT